MDSQLENERSQGKEKDFEPKAQLNLLHSIMQYNHFYIIKKN